VIAELQEEVLAVIMHRSSQLEPVVREWLANQTWLTADLALIGVVDSRLADVPLLINSGSVPKNVCYAIKSSRIQNLLESHPEIVDKLSRTVPVGRMAAPDLYESSKGSIVRIEATTD
jgi:hypothetical protein